MAKKKKQNRVKRVLSALNPRSLKGGMLLFALVFALGGGGYYVYRSFAYTLSGTAPLSKAPGEPTVVSDPSADDLTSIFKQKTATASSTSFVTTNANRAVNLPPQIKRGDCNTVVNNFKHMARMHYGIDLINYGDDVGKGDIYPRSCFGNKTYNFVVTFQKYFGLTPDGIVGNNTWNTFFNIAGKEIDKVYADNIKPGATMAKLTSYGSYLGGVWINADRSEYPYNYITHNGCASKKGKNLVIFPPPNGCQVVPHAYNTYWMMPDDPNGGYGLASFVTILVP